MTARGYLLDTNVLSETRKHNPHPGVLTFLEEVESELLYVSVLSLGELQKGLELRRRSASGAEIHVVSALDGWVRGY